ncbi:MULTISPECIES: hypothetical protein [Deinococcus]|uniref:Alpha/beta hydrolase n=1 Tax=Deinococcus rufus TaxID=2136097 RepID=A0ABV7Z5K2_9DEIO|nr:hypothetical protein [Deinococcus sp. AB2017081]WQE95857.1 hypothetical protein U2P90_02940 [Deinococcus sp. AB2017081]
MPTELHVYPGAFHASEHLAPEAALSRRIIETRLTALRNAHAPGRTLPREADLTLAR